MSYVDEVIERVVKENPNEPEFHQAVKEVLDSLRPVVDANEKAFRRDALLERLVNPERQIKNFLNRLMEFRLIWVFLHYSLDYFIYIRHTVSSFMKKEKTPLTVGAFPTTLKTSLPSSYINLF